MNPYTLELKSVTDEELVAIWNVFQFSLRMITDESEADLWERINAVSHELNCRAIPHENGKKIIKAVA